MCLVNKILIGLVVIAIGVCFYFSAITLKTHSVWREEGNKQEKQLEQLKEEIALYNFGKGQPDTEDYVRSIYEQEKYLRALQDLRGPVYRDCEVQSQFATNRLFNVYIPGATELQLPVNTPLYVFRAAKEDEEKLTYLGSFRVRSFGVNPETAKSFVSVEPTRAEYINNERMKALLSERFVGRWTLFMNMPIDKAEHGSTNEDYVPFDTEIQYYVGQEVIMQELLEKQKRHIAYMSAIVGAGQESSDDARVGESTFHHVYSTLKRESDNRLTKIYAKYEEENQAMKQANQALAARVAELERKKAGYQDSINTRIKPITTK